MTNQNEEGSDQKKIENLKEQLLRYESEKQNAELMRKLREDP